MTRASPPELEGVEADIYAALRPVFATIFRRDVPLTAALTARDLPDWDSFKQIEIIIAVEERFAFKFTSGEIDAMASLGDLVAIVERRGRHPLRRSVLP